MIRPTYTDYGSLIYTGIPNLTHGTGTWYGWAADGIYMDEWMDGWVMGVIYIYIYIYLPMVPQPAGELAG